MSTTPPSKTCFFEGTNFKSDVMAANVTGQKIVNSKISKYGFLRELLIHLRKYSIIAMKNNEGIEHCRKEKTKNLFHDNIIPAMYTQIAGLLFLHSYISHAFIEAKI